jgi:hypothetical protein
LLQEIQIINRSIHQTAVKLSLPLIARVVMIYTFVIKMVTMHISLFHLAMQAAVRQDGLPTAAKLPLTTDHVVMVTSLLSR